MRKWGIVISLFYAVIVLFLLFPAFLLMVGGLSLASADFYKTLWKGYAAWYSWMPIGLVLSGQAILLFLSVDTSFKRLKPRVHIAVSCIAATALLALLTCSAIYSLAAAANRFEALGETLESPAKLAGIVAIIWVLWAIPFYLCLRKSSGVTARAVSWLLRGSILELLIAIPCHIVVRRRGDCCAPIVTSFGIVTGIAIMLLSFGPSVLFLYKKRIDTYAARGSK
jgi:hypothetical protein